MPLRRRNERGAAAPLVAILMATGVITGMLALTADVGNMQWERRQLQNGADATATALAALCASDQTKCNAAAANTELDADLLDANAADQRTQFDKARPDGGVCGSAASGMAHACPDGSFESLPSCPPLPGWLNDEPDIPYVEAYTRTETTDGGTILPKFFAQTLTGNTDTSVTACARAAWGSPVIANASASVVVSACEWAEYTTDARIYALPPVYTSDVGATTYGYGGTGQPAWPAKEVGIGLHKDGDSGCTYDGDDRPGGFGYVETTDGCQATTVLNNWAHVSTGNAAAGDCKAALEALFGKTMLIPIFDCVVKDEPTTTTMPADCDAGKGNNAYYHIRGWGAFYLTGYTIPSYKQRIPSLTSTDPCASTNGCLSGWFTTKVLEADKIAAPGGGTDFGTVAVKLAG